MNGIVKKQEEKLKGTRRVRSSSNAQKECVIP